MRRTRRSLVTQSGILKVNTDDPGRPCITDIVSDLELDEELFVTLRHHGRVRHNVKLRKSSNKVFCMTQGVLSGRDNRVTSGVVWSMRDGTLAEITLTTHFITLYTSYRAFLLPKGTKWHPQYGLLERSDGRVHNLCGALGSSEIKLTLSTDTGVWTPSPLCCREFKLRELDRKRSATILAHTNYREFAAYAKITHPLLGGKTSYGATNPKVLSSDRIVRAIASGDKTQWFPIVDAQAGVTLPVLLASVRSTLRRSVVGSGCINEEIHDVAPNIETARRWARNMMRGPYA